MSEKDSSAAGAAPFEPDATPSAALKAKLRIARRRNPDAFICQANMIVENNAKCEHCGSGAGDICRRLPGVQQDEIERLREAASGMLEALEQAEIIIRHTQPFTTNDGGKSPMLRTESVLAVVRAALRAAEAAGIKPTA